MEVMALEPHHPFTFFHFPPALSLPLSLLAGNSFECLRRWVGSGQTFVFVGLICRRRRRRRVADSRNKNWMNEHDFAPFRAARQRRRARTRRHGTSRERREREWVSEGGVKGEMHLDLSALSLRAIS